MVLAALSTACRPPPQDSVFFQEETLLLGHRGGCAVAPENTMAAFRQVAEQGMGFELDIRLCASGELVVLHDPTVDRTTTGTGRVADLTLTQIQALDAGIRFHPSFAGERIPTLTEVLDAFGGQVPIDIEVKTARATDRPALADALARVLEVRPLQRHVLVSSFDSPFLVAFQARTSAYPRSLILGRSSESGYTWYPKLWLRRFFFGQEAVPDVLKLDAALLTPRRVARLKGQGYRVFAWTVNTPEQARQLQELGVNGLISDQPQGIREALR